jgi:hypothetical protein
MPSSRDARRGRALSHLFACVAVALASLAAACSGSNDATVSQADAGASAVAGRACPQSSPLTYESFGAPFLLSYCTGCHSSQVTEARRQGAPLGVDFDSLADVRRWAGRIYERAADVHTTMPPAGGPSAELRKQLGEWLACGAPGEGVQLAAESSLPPPAPLAAECNEPVATLPASVLQRCSAATMDCIKACAVEDVGCEGRCIQADTTPAADYYRYKITCNTCIYLQRYACADKEGCHSTVAALECCRKSKCADSSDEGCVSTRCATEVYAYGYCQTYVTPKCDSFVDGPARACFPP